MQSASSALAMPEPTRPYLHDVQNTHPDYSPPKASHMPPNPLDQVVKAQQEMMEFLRQVERERQATVTMANLQALGDRVIGEIQSLRKDVDDRFTGVHEELKGVKARVTILETGKTPSGSHRARQLQSVPPRSPEEIGLKATDSGTGWRVDDAAAMVRAWNEQEQQRIGAEKALDEERQEMDRQQAAFDRRLKNWGIVMGIASVVLAGVVATITFFLTHVSIQPIHN